MYTVASDDTGPPSLSTSHSVDVQLDIEELCRNTKPLSKRVEIGCRHIKVFHLCSPAKSDLDMGGRKLQENKLALFPSKCVHHEVNMLGDLSGVWILH